MPSAFLLTPVSAATAGDERPAVYRTVRRAGREAIADADLIIAVCTGKNANVFYELGLAEAMGHRPIPIAPDARHLPFDEVHCRCHMYGGKRLTAKNLWARLVKAIGETLADAG